MVKTLPSAGLAIRPAADRSGSALTELTGALRQLPMPVIGRIEDDALILDLRCLHDEVAFLANLEQIPWPNDMATESSG